jgi:hypothetical protein
MQSKYLRIRPLKSEHLFLMVLVFLVCLILACRKENISEFYADDSIGDAGLIEDFELYEPGENTIYINPENSNDSDEDGSIEHPFDSFQDIIWEDNTTYALKRGTQINEEQIMVSANGVIICSYGDGDRPLIKCIENSAISGNRYALICHWDGIDNLTIRDLEITAPDAISCIRILSNCTGVTIINCKTYGSEWGIRSISNTDLVIHNTEVYDIQDDGMYIKNTNNIEISNCYVHHVNQKWKTPDTPETEAGGDGIQFEACNNWHVHNNLIDRRGNGNKFCFISNNADQDNGVLEYNVLLGPSYNGSSSYFHNGDGIVVRYNYMAECAGAPVYTHGTNFLIYYNIFNGNGSPLYASKSAKVYNNLFYKMEYCISGGTIEVTNNIIDTDKSDPLKVQNLTGSNNLFTGENAIENSINGDPAYRDEFSYDFHLLEESDCINNGIFVGITKDLDGISIQPNNTPDIGPYQYN